MEKCTYLTLKAMLSDSIKASIEKLGFKANNIGDTIDFSKSFGDISCSIAFRIAKEQKKNPSLIAKDIVSKLGKQDYVEKTTVENGFINFHLDKKEFCSAVIEYALHYDAKTLSDTGKGKRVIIEYTSANPIHPLHVGQLRNALLGDSLSNIYDACNYSVEREDYIDDFGLQMVQAMWGFLHLEHGSEKKFDHMLGKVYVDANKHMELHDIKEELSKLSQLIEQDGTYESNITREVAESCVRAQYQTLFDYKIYHNLMVWESDIVREHLFEKAMDMLLKSGVTEKVSDGEYKGCTVIDLSKIKDLPAEFQGIKENIKVLIRSDGTPTYVAKDIAFHMWKFGLLDNQFKYSKFIEKQDNNMPLYTTSREGTKMDFGKAARAINIIDVKQSHPQELLKVSFRGMGKEEIADNIIHLAYGRVELEGSSLAGRKGTWIGNTADDVLEESIQKARTLIGSKVELSNDEREKISRSVALSAIKFEFLKMAPEKTIIFSWEWALNFEGNSGPYAQYMHARATRILGDAPKGFESRKELIDNITDYEFALVKLISKSSYIVEKAAIELRPNVITEYINELSYAFSSFYENSPILKADSEDQTAFRLMLTLAFKETLKEMLALLGIDALERM